MVFFFYIYYFQIYNQYQKMMAKCEFKNDDGKKN